MSGSQKHICNQNSIQFELPGRYNNVIEQRRAVAGTGGTAPAVVLQDVKSGLASVDNQQTENLTKNKEYFIFTTVLYICFC